MVSGFGHAFEVLLYRSTRALRAPPRFSSLHSMRLVSKTSLKRSGRTLDQLRECSVWRVSSTPPSYSVRLLTQTPVPYHVAMLAPRQGSAPTHDTVDRRKWVHRPAPCRAAE
jgi:hypothetical protein